MGKLVQQARAHLRASSRTSPRSSRVSASRCATSSRTRSRKRENTEIVTIAYPEEKRVYPSASAACTASRTAPTARRAAWRACAAARPVRRSASTSRPASTQPGDPRHGYERYPKVFVIDELRCIFCGYCVEACPCDAIRMDTGVHMPASTRREHFIFDKEMLMSHARPGRHLPDRQPAPRARRPQRTPASTASTSTEHASARSSTGALPRRALRYCKLRLCDRQEARLVCSTRAVHGGEPRVHAHDALTPPIVQTATYTFANTAELVAYMEGHIEREEYGRYGNPSVRAARAARSPRSRASRTRSRSRSGMAAITIGHPGAGQGRTRTWCCSPTATAARASS